jgi:hypothetical protein
VLFTSSQPVKRSVPTCLFLGACLIFFLALSPRLSAQTASSGVVLGTVTDASGAVVPGVEVDLTNTATNVTLKQSTSTRGQYLFAQVAPGNYTLAFMASRFRTATVTNVIVEVNKSFTANMQMEVGEVNQTVEVQASAQAELQTTDAQVGDVVSGQELEHLPTLHRNALELRQLQPATTPGGMDSGGTVAGARSDQNTITLDGVDISDSIIGGQGAPAIEDQPLGVDNVQEFRTGVTNSGVTFDRSAGGQTTLISRSGSNAFHGDAYWFHQNDELNANTWDNNSVGIPRPESKDNRVGLSVGGPIIKDKTFFYSNYEIHRFPQISSFTDTVPTASLKAGMLTFNDANGNPTQYDLATSSVCGSSQNQPCDPRSLGISPTVRALWALMPPGNTNAAGDGLNTMGYKGFASTPTKDDDVSFRLDHNFTDRLHFLGRYFYSRDLPPYPSYDIRNGTPHAIGTLPDREDGAYGGLDYQISSNITNSFRFAWLRSRADAITESGAASAAALNLTGTATTASGILVALQPAVTYLNVPIDNSVGGSRTQLLNGVTKEIVDNLFWNKGTHTITAGTDIHFLPFLLSHTDHNIATTSPTVLMDSSGQTGTVTLPASDAPPTCSGSVTTDCLPTLSDAARWDSLYLGTLGIVNNVNLVGARDGKLQPYPVLTPINSNTTEGAYSFYAQDTWRMTRTLTLTYGLEYGWQTPAREANGLQSILANNDANNTIITAPNYISAKASAANQGNAYNPTLSFVPIRQSGRSTLYNTDYGDWGPRASVAWNPSFQDGVLGHVFGPGKTVLRSGFGISYDRTNIVNNLLSSLLGVGFSDVFTNTPLCNASGTPGGGCPSTPQAGADPALNNFRVGQDGTIPLPTVTALTSPIVPSSFNLFANPSAGEVDAIGVDPTAYKVGRNYMLDFTIQRELPANLLLETGYIGRLGRNLPSAIDLDASPYMVKDPTSGQTFAQAFDNVGCVLRGSAGKQITPSFTCPAAQQDQPFFENQLPGLGALLGPGVSSTQAMAALVGTNLANGDAFTTFLVMNSYRDLIGYPSYNNLQVYVANILETGQGISNYNAWFVTLHKRASKGLQFDLNYTLSKSLDEQGQVQNNVARFSTPFNQKLQYGPSIFDHRNVFNATYDYELPFGQGRRFSFGGDVANKFISGWYTAGIFSATSGTPVYPTQGANYGGALSSGPNGSVADIATASVGTGVHSGAAGALNLFANPTQAAASFRVPLLSVDGRTGEANPIYGLGFWNFDIELGKETSIAENVKVRLSVDAFNLFNNVNFQTPTLDLTNPATFGDINSTLTLTNHASSARYLQLGLRVEF